MWSRAKRNEALRALGTFGRPHWRHLLWGGIATLLVVGCRIALPWPLRGIVEIVFPGPSGTAGFPPSAEAPGLLDPVLRLGGEFFLLALGCGLFELIQRVSLMKFSAWTVHDLRAAAVRGAARDARQNKPTADLIARIVGDSARVKAGLSGVLVHVLQNGLLLIGISVVLIGLSGRLGAIFLTGSFLAVGLGLWNSIPVARNSSRQRRKEGKYAVAIQEWLDRGLPEGNEDDVNVSSARKEVRSTRLVALSSLEVHAVVAATIALALWVGAAAVHSGNAAAGDLFLIVAYGSSLHRRTVQIGRQAARSGKVLACAQRLAALLRREREPRSSDAPIAVGPLRSRLRLEEVRLRSSSGRPPRIRRTTLDLEASSRVAVLGSSGAGKSSLLQILAGRATPEKGRVLWDEEAVDPGSAALRARTGYLAAEPVFSPTALWKLLGLKSPDGLDGEQEETLRAIGALGLVRDFSSGLRQKVGSRSLSGGEARTLALASLLLRSTEPLWVLDDPALALARNRAGKRIDRVLDLAGDRLVVVAMSRVVRLERFDRVLELRGGRVRFDGPPQEWRSREPAGASAG